jgi:hypothetical protein
MLQEDPGLDGCPSISRRRLLLISLRKETPSASLATCRRNGKATRARLRSLASLQGQRAIRLRWAATELFVVQTEPGDALSSDRTRQRAIDSNCSIRKKSASQNIAREVYVSDKCV